VLFPSCHGSYRKPCDTKLIRATRGTITTTASRNYRARDCNSHRRNYASLTVDGMSVKKHHRKDRATSSLIQQNITGRWNYTILQQTLFIFAAFNELHFVLTQYLLPLSSLFLQASTGRKQLQQPWGHVRARSMFVPLVVMGLPREPLVKQRLQVRN
jgi:hypothetical protein